MTKKKKEFRTFCYYSRWNPRLAVTLLTSFGGGLLIKSVQKNKAILLYFWAKPKHASDCIQYTNWALIKKIRRPGFYNPYVADILEIFLTTKIAFCVFSVYCI